MAPGATCDMTQPRTTGAWIVKRIAGDDTSWLLGGPHDEGTIRRWWSWGGKDQARVYPSQAAAKRAMKGYIGMAEAIIIERL